MVGQISDCFKDKPVRLVEDICQNLIERKRNISQDVVDYEILRSLRSFKDDKKCNTYAEKRGFHWPAVILSISEESPSLMLLEGILQSVLKGPPSRMTGFEYSQIFDIKIAPLWLIYFNILYFSV